MRIRQTTVLLLLWLACQQAFAIVSVFPVSTDMHPDEQIIGHYHDDHAKNMGHDEVNHEPENAIECCDTECQCCIGGCQSVLGNTTVLIPIMFADHPEDHYLFVIPKISINSLYRPPIIV